MIDVFTDDEVAKARTMFKEGKTTQEVCDALVKPAMARIDQETGQTNDPMYMAYRLEYFACVVNV